jgi:putative ABC transport system ATP-binding protein
MGSDHREATPSTDTLPLLTAGGIGRRVVASWLLDHVSLNIARGDRISLVGPSGSGKTLLLRALALLDPLDTGEILWCGRRLRGHEVPYFRSRVMYLHQRPSLLEGTVELNLRQPFSLAVHRDKVFARERITAILAALGRDASFLLKQQSDLSGGEAQLTSLLRAIQLDPDLLLLDEPTSALDSASTAAVESLVASWYEERPEERAIVWVSHDLDQAHRVSSTVRLLRDGRIDEDE